MNSSRFIVHYLKWHYGAGVTEFWLFWKNILWFGYHFFSLPLLWRTLFSPIFRIHETSQGQGFDIQLILQNVLLNLTTRIVGFAMRTVVMLAGAVFEIAAAVCAGITFAIWLMFPFLAPGLFLFGLSAFFY